MIEIILGVLYSECPTVLGLLGKEKECYEKHG